jgi:hypothetical protein
MEASIKILENIGIDKVYETVAYVAVILINISNTFIDLVLP